MPRNARVSGRGVVVLFLAVLTGLTSSPAVLAACVEVSYVSGRELVNRSRQVPVTYQEPVTRPVSSTSYEYQVTGYRTAYRSVTTPVTRTGYYEVWDYYLVHYNRWAGGIITSCVSWSDPANCGSHGWGWRSHWDEYVWYVSYYVPYSYTENVTTQVPYDEPVYELVPVTTTTTVTEWVTRTTTVTEYYTEWVDVYSTRLECSTAPNEVRHTLTYDPAGGEGSVPAPQSYPAGTTVNLTASAPNRDGYSFSGWVTADGTAVTRVTLNADTVVRAAWTPLAALTHRLSYDGNGGDGVAPTGGSHPGGTVVTLAGPGSLVRSGYSFAGWSTTRTGTPVATVTMSSDRTVYAVWRSVTVRPS
jgi:uncharacterized repeat protein (TIGR02543 family)